VSAESENTRAAVDPDGLAKYLANEMPQFSGDFEIARLGEGQSCLTFLVRGDRWEFVLRRPPRGDLPPSAFDVTREYRVMRALHGTRSYVPVAEPLALCTDTSVIGAPFYLMRTVDGVVVRSSVPTALDTPDNREQMGEQLLDTLVALQSVDYAAVGLEGFGRPDGYLERQMRRMTQLWSLAKFRDQPDIEAVGAWLAENMPRQGRSSIVHGDFKLDNVIFAPNAPPKLIAVVDWEMSTLGDPLADLGWLLYFWRDPGDEQFGLTVTTVTDLEGFPRRRDLLARYVEQTGADVSEVLWYVALAGWKIAIIMEGSYRRFLGGITDHPQFAELEHFVPALAARSARAMAGNFGV
jgi:aminoglycoside phosphotransferase (APT) family kinase protein